MSKAATLKISSTTAGKVDNFRQALYREAETLFSDFIPLKIIKLDSLLKDEGFSITETASLRAPLDIPIPDPPSPEDEEMETDKNEDDEKKKKKPPKCGFIKGNEKITMVLERVKPEIVAFRETIITVTCWIQHLIPKIEDGNDFGVAIQEKILERIAAVRTKVDGFQTNINKYFTERGDAVAKASKETHVMDYRSLVHEKDEAIYSDIRVIVLDIRGFYAELYDIISKNLEKVTNPKGEEKPSMY
ncbi:proteasome activator complex subunit 2 [Simochromis diagramma]|uniref:Proteasome activator complex subunit 2 n=1 Tax=Haplochromis burtoni TaxID=8153 RepID=A0A3Q2WU64_HAPBU|nr:proteasome activator complex subunit 2 [Haplochromis burtoni]XP_039899814.1 proteasome activator complex subunit 2 [Simochromis diagramma]